MTRHRDPEETHAIDYRGPTVIADLGSKWSAIYSLATDGSDVVISEVRIVPKGELPPGGLTHRLLRELKPGTAVRMFEKDLREQSTAEGQELQSGLVQFLALGAIRAHGLEAGMADIKQFLDERAQHWQPWSKVLRRLSPRGNPTLRLATAAALYIEQLQLGSRSPVKDVARLQKRPTSNVRDDLHLARDRGLLTHSTGRGRAGGELTDVALEVLNKEENTK